MEGVAGSTRPSIPVPLLWEMEMPLLSGTYLQQECARAEQDRDIHCTTGGRIDLEPSAFEELSLLDQEEALVEDLICALRGFEGTFIKTRSRREGDTVEFYVSGPNAGELKNSVTMLVQLCTDRSQLETFRCTARSYDQGLIRHALGEELFQVLTELDLVVVEVDDRWRMGQLSLLSEVQDLCQPFMDLFRVLAALLQHVTQNNLMGAPLLNYLSHEAICFPRGGNHRVKLDALWKASYQPYTEMLERWLFEGILDDSYSEFMIEEDHSVSMTDSIYWEKRYQIRPHAVPDFLQRAAKEILTTGKCLTAIRECGHSAKVAGLGTSDSRLSSIEDETAYLECIQIAYQESCAELLRLIKEEYKLMPRLQSLKNCFFHYRGDFILDFMDFASGELSKHAGRQWQGAVSKNTLVPLLERSLRTSLCFCDPFHKDITLALDMKPFAVRVKWVKEELGNMLAVVDEDVEDMEYTVHSKEGEVRCIAFDGPNENDVPSTSHSPDVADGWNAFTMDYRVPWPISLVVSQKALKAYKIIFQHLFSCRRIHHQLQMNCLAVARQRNIMNKKAHPMVFRWQFLGQRMLPLLETILQHATSIVLEPNWRKMEGQLLKANSIDEMVEYHTTFLHCCLHQCLLHHQPFLLRLTQLRDIFVEYVGAQRMLDQHDSSLESKLRRLENSFEEVLRGLTASLQTIDEPSSQSLLQGLLELGKRRPAGDRSLQLKEQVRAGRGAQ